MERAKVFSNLKQERAKVIAKLKQERKNNIQNPEFIREVLTGWTKEMQEEFIDKAWTDALAASNKPIIEEKDAMDELLEKCYAIKYN